MERTNTADDPKILWVNTSGTFRGKFSRKIYKPNEKFKARISDIPEAFRDTIKPVNQDAFDEAERAEIDIDVAQKEYSVVSASPGWYDVLDSNGKRMNENRLRQAAARELLTMLEKD